MLNYQRVMGFITRLQHPWVLDAPDSKATPGQQAATFLRCCHHRRALLAVPGDWEKPTFRKLQALEDCGDSTTENVGLITKKVWSRLVVSLMIDCKRWLWVILTGFVWRTVYSSMGTRPTVWKNRGFWALMLLISEWPKAHVNIT